MNTENNETNHFYLITTTYNNMNEIKLKDTLYAVKKNLNHSLIHKYIILFEVNDLEEINYNTFIDKNNKDVFKNKIKPEFLDLLENNKIELYLIKKRPNYEFIFKFCNNYDNRIWILTNSDIFFPVWNTHKLKVLTDLNYNKKCVVLTRYNIMSELTEHIKKKQQGFIHVHNKIKYRTQHKNGGSIDSWIFKTPFNFNKINLDFNLGVPECDGRMNFQLSKIRKVINPCFSIISIHKHVNWSPEGYNRIEHEGKIYNRKEFNTFMSKKGLKTLRIPFSILKKNICNNRTHQ